jgi:hypothetical protein
MFKATSIIILVVCTLPGVLVFPVVGPANLLYSLVLTSASLSALYFIRNYILCVCLILAGSTLQFLTPVPYWLCVDGGYRLCLWGVAQEWQNAEYNVIDLIIWLLYMTSFALWRFSFGLKNSGQV